MKARYGFIALGMAFFIAVAGAKAPPPVSSGPMTLDLDPAPGDQGKREVKGVKPGATVIVEVAALRGAKGATGFTATVTFDTAQVAYEGFEVGPLIPEIQTLPLLKGGRLEIGGGQFGAGGGAAQDAGSLGVLRFRTTSRFKTRTALTLTRARYRRRGATQDFEAHVRIVLWAGASGPSGAKK
jgi:hypothetical protein